MSIAGEVSAAEGWVSLSGDLGEMVAASWCVRPPDQNPGLIVLPGANGPNKIPSRRWATSPMRPSAFQIGEPNDRIPWSPPGPAVSNRASQGLTQVPAVCSSKCLLNIVTWP